MARGRSPNKERNQRRFGEWVRQVRFAEAENAGHVDRTVATLARPTFIETAEEAAKLDVFQSALASPSPERLAMAAIADITGGQTSVVGADRLESAVLHEIGIDPLGEVRRIAEERNVVIDEDHAATRVIEKVVRELMSGRRFLVFGIDTEEPTVYPNPGTASGSYEGPAPSWDSLDGLTPDRAAIVYELVGRKLGVKPSHPAYGRELINQSAKIVKDRIHRHAKDVVLDAMNELQDVPNAGVEIVESIVADEDAPKRDQPVTRNLHMFLNAEFSSPRVSAESLAIAKLMHRSVVGEQYLTREVNGMKKVRLEVKGIVDHLAEGEIGDELRTHLRLVGFLHEFGSLAEVLPSPKSDGREYRATQKLSPYKITQEWSPDAAESVIDNRIVELWVDSEGRTPDEVRTFIPAVLLKSTQTEIMVGTDTVLKRSKMAAALAMFYRGFEVVRNQMFEDERRYEGPHSEHPAESGRSKEEFTYIKNGHRLIKSDRFGLIPFRGYEEPTFVIEDKEDFEANVPCYACLVNREREHGGEPPLEHHEHVVVRVDGRSRFVGKPGAVMLEHPEREWHRVAREDGTVARARVEIWHNDHLGCALDVHVPDTRTESQKLQGLATSHHIELLTPEAPFAPTEEELVDHLLDRALRDFYEEDDEEVAARKYEENTQEFASELEQQYPELGDELS